MRFSRRRRFRFALLTSALTASLVASSGSLPAHAQEAPAATEAPAPAPAPAPTPEATAAPAPAPAPPAAPDPAATPATPAAPAATAKAPKRRTKKASAARGSAAPGKAFTGGTSIEVDISSQRLYLRKGGKLVRTLRVSTGSGKRYCVKGSCATARTPRGRFRVYNRIGGWRTSRLGRLYNPLYFTGGFAIHGSPSVPSYPASHGCVRITMSDARWLPSSVPNGTPVWVHD